MNRENITPNLACHIFMEINGTFHVQNGICGKREGKGFFHCKFPLCNEFSNIKLALGFLLKQKIISG